MTDVRSLLRSGTVYLDGGMGTLLQKRGMKAGEAPERWGLTHRDIIRSIHRAYFDAGSHIVMANTFGVNPVRYDAQTLELMVRTAVEDAKEARRESGAPQEKFVALDLGPTGQLLKPFGPLGFEEAVAAFAQTVRLGAAAGVDCVAIETMNDSQETRAALLAVKENCDLPVLVCNAYGSDGKLMSGSTPEAVVAMMEGLGADAVGINCSYGPETMAPVVLRYLACASVPVICKPNAGLPAVVAGETVYDVDEASFAASMRKLAEAGVRVLGGCCGTTPDYIAALTRATRDVEAKPVEPKRAAVIASRSHALTLSERPVMIGERINPTGKKRFRQALAESDMGYILAEGIAQEERGADALDVNVGAPGIDEKAMLPRVTEELQAVTDLPLQLDTADPAAMEAALRVYNGKAMINSVNGSEASMAAVFPLIKKYGGVAVALTLNEKGIPETAEGRLAIAERILARAEAEGISRRDLVFDPLTMTVSADRRAARVTLEALRLIREKTGCGTVLGVSNVSFGLPAREVIGSAFLTMALERGLSAAIMNPKSDAMLGAFRSFLTLNGMDANCADYIAFASALPQTQPAAAPAASAQPKEVPGGKGLRYAVTKGLCADAARFASEALDRGREALALVQEEIIPALDDVGRGFEAKTLFLPQLMMSAEAAEAAFREVKARASAASAMKRCAVVLATVKGDVHDIGKNIVRLLLENYGYQVTDLGRDVPPETVLEAVIRLHAPICGLSALMTTTVPAMAETVDLIHREAPWCKVMVGGAVLTEAFAAEIHADGYGRDAMAAVRCAERFEAEQNA
ncbi:MAG: homocysteine S-methyltransferase family protein [Clostridia bacterium]|nr:homocysteine S-methyltransferase family protein [Clostridia bacterium]